MILSALGMTCNNWVQAEGGCFFKKKISLNQQPIKKMGKWVLICLLSLPLYSGLQTWYFVNDLKIQITILMMPTWQHNGFAMLCPLMQLEAVGLSPILLCHSVDSCKPQNCHLFLLVVNLNNFDNGIVKIFKWIINEISFNF